MPLILTQILSKKHIWYDMSSLQCSKHIWYWIITAHPNIFRFSRQWFQFHPSLLPGLMFCLHNDYHDRSEISTLAHLVELPDLLPLKAGHPLLKDLTLKVDQQLFDTSGFLIQIHCCRWYLRANIIWLISIMYFIKHTVMSSQNVKQILSLRAILGLESSVSEPGLPSTAEAHMK